MVDDNKNIVDNNNGEQNKLINESSSAIVSTKEKGEGKRRRENLSEEEKKSRLREKNRLRMKALRESLSDEQKAQLREQERVKRQQQRARLSDEEREYIKQQELQANHSDVERDGFSDAKRQKKGEAKSSDGQQQQQRRATLSEEERALVKKKDAERHRLKYHEESSFAQKVFEDINSRSTSDEDDEDEALKRAKYWILYREKRNAQSRIYKRERYAKLKEAEKKLTQIAEEAQSTGEGGVSETEVQHLQLLADKRKRILEYSRNYKRAYQKQPIEQPEIQVEGCPGSGQEEVQKSLDSCAVKERMPRGNVPDDSEESLINFER